jgi:hypothetical protein
MYTNMWGYIIGGFIISYYLTFCGAVAYVSCKEYQEERRQLMREYEELSRENPGIEMFIESEYENRRQRLEPIMEEDEEKVFDIV